MAFYLETPYSDLLYNRDEAARDIADLFCDSNEAAADFVEYYNSDALEPVDLITLDDLTAHFCSFEEWTVYRAYDLISDAERDGRAELYGVTVYADAATEALEERINDMIDPWSAPESRVATFCALYNVTDLVSDIIEYIVNELDSPESIDEAAERVRLIDDIRAHRRARREKVTQ